MSSGSGVGPYRAPPAPRIGPDYLAVVPAPAPPALADAAAAAEPPPHERSRHANSTVALRLWRWPKATSHQTSVRVFRADVLALGSLDERVRLAGGLASGRRDGFAAFEGAKPGRSTDLRGVVGDGGGGAVARLATRAASGAGARTVSGSGTAGNLLLEPTRLGGVAGEIGEGGGGGAADHEPRRRAAGGALITPPPRQRPWPSRARRP